MRCFIGFELDENCRELMRVRIEPFANRLQRELGWPIRLVPPPNWHLTCLFFKDLGEAERAAVWQEVLRNVEAGVWDDLLFPFESLALWPAPRKPSLVCLAAPESPAVGAWPLSQRLEEEPFSKGDTEHLRAYRPHITLMRFRGGAVRPYWREWQAFGDRIPQIPPTAVRFNRVSLLLSDVSPTKPIYPREYTAKLKTALKPQNMLRRPAALMLEE
jgi:2'-5' RNA ligase